MGASWGEQVSDATSAVVAMLGPLTDRSWDRPAGELDWTCHRTAAHIAAGPVAYATQLAGRADDAYLRIAVTVPDDEPPAGLLRVVHGVGHALAAVVDGAPDDARAWHWGPTDASGFAAMGMGELLVHGHDIARGLGHEWRPPVGLARAVVTRLDAGATVVDDPATHLLWSTGRIAVAGVDPPGDWVWRAARP